MIAQCKKLPLDNRQHKKSSLHIIYITYTVQCTVHIYEQYLLSLTSLFRTSEGAAFSAQVRVKNFRARVNFNK